MQAILVMMKPARAATRRFLPTSPFNTTSAAPPVTQFALQDQVTHDKYGLGRVSSARRRAEQHPRERQPGMAPPQPCRHDLQCKRL